MNATILFTLSLMLDAGDGELLRIVD